MTISYSYDEVNAIFSNIGVKYAIPTNRRYSLHEVIKFLCDAGKDVKCGACMSIAFCGLGLPGDEHTCGLVKKNVTFGPAREG